MVHILEEVIQSVLEAMTEGGASINVNSKL